MELPFILAFVGSFLTVAGGIYGLFVIVGDVVHRETKHAASKWLQNLPLKPNEDHWPGVFIRLFDRVFGEKHWSWACFLRSSLASYVTFIIVASIYISVMGNSGVIKFNREFLLIVPLVVLFNVFPDFFSLLQTRYLLGKMREMKRMTIWPTVLLIDLLATGIVFYIFAYLGFKILEISTPPPNGNMLTVKWVVMTLVKGLDFFNSESIMGLFVYSTFFTSFWLWLYVLSGIIIKSLYWVGRPFAFVRTHLDIEGKPFKAMGFILILLVSFCYALGGMYLYKVG